MEFLDRDGRGVQAPMNWPGFLGPSSPVQAIYADCERAVNLYFEPQDVQSGKPSLLSTPGFESFLMVADVGGRAMLSINQRTFAVMGAGVYEIFQTATDAKYGTVTQNQNLAQIISNGIGGNQLGISSGDNFYSLNLTTNVLSAAILTGTATQVGMIDGYGVAFHAGTIRLSNLNDFTTFDPTQFAIRSSAPDNWLAMCVNAPDIWLIGEHSGDVWYDAGAFPFPLAPRPGVTFPYGIAAPFSIAVAGDSVFWLSKTTTGTGIVVRARGYVPQSCSSLALENAIAGYLRTSRIDDAEGQVYQKAGHTFYILRFPSANATWAYDLRTGQWAERSKFNYVTGLDQVWHPRVITEAFGKHLVGDPSSGTIAVMDDTIPTELDGTGIRRLRIPPAMMVQPGGRGFIGRFELGIQTGVGTQTGQGADPVAMLRWSRDYAQTWGNQSTRKIGKVGMTTWRTFWNHCGSSQKAMVPELTITDPVTVRITSADWVGSGFARSAAA